MGAYEDRLFSLFCFANIWVCLHQTLQGQVCQYCLVLLHDTWGLALPCALKSCGHPLSSAGRWDLHWPLKFHTLFSFQIFSTQRIPPGAPLHLHQKTAKWDLPEIPRCPRQIRNKALLTDLGQFSKQDRMKGANKSLEDSRPGSSLECSPPAERLAVANPGSASRPYTGRRPLGTDTPGPSLHSPLPLSLAGSLPLFPLAPCRPF